MSRTSLSNVSVREYRIILANAGCTFIRITGGHEFWTKPGLTRPIAFQTHINPVPERIIKQGLTALKLTRQEFFDLLK